MLDSLLNRKCLDVMHSSSVKDFSRQFADFSQSLGFSTFSALVITDHSPTLTEFQTVTNAPEAYLAVFEDLDLGRIDPVSQHCKRSSMPITWDQRNYASPRQRELWEQQAQFGYRSGFAFAMHFDKGRHYMFGADWDHDRCENVPGYKKVLERMLIFATHAQAAAFELCIPAAPEPGNSWSLAKSELEALRWTMDGRTSWEVGEAMSISERHATLLICRAMNKLQCSTKYEAGLRAIRFGLIQSQ